MPTNNKLVSMSHNSLDIRSQVDRTTHNNQNKRTEKINTGQADNSRSRRWCSAKAPRLSPALRLCLEASGGFPVNIWGPVVAASSPSRRDERVRDVLLNRVESNFSGVSMSWMVLQSRGVFTFSIQPAAAVCRCVFRVAACGSRWPATQGRSCQGLVACMDAA